jgi:uncharacterized membrane protein (UPF0127 family)
MKYLCNIFLLFGLIACGNNSGKTPSIQNSPDQTSTVAPSTINQNDPLKYVELISPDNEVIKTSIAYTSAAQTQGLQGIKDSQFAEDEGKLFFYLNVSARTFWMPNTHFNLDIIYLDQNMRITDIVWNLPHYTGNISSEIPRAPTITSRHVLEMKSGSALSSKLEIGDTLQWKSSLSIKETELRIRQQK